VDQPPGETIRMERLDALLIRRPATPTVRTEKAPPITLIEIKARPGS